MLPALGPPVSTWIATNSPDLAGPRMRAVNGGAATTPRGDAPEMTTPVRRFSACGSGGGRRSRSLAAVNPDLRTTSVDDGVPPGLAVAADESPRPRTPTSASSALTAFDSVGSAAARAGAGGRPAAGGKGDPAVPSVGGGVTRPMYTSSLDVT